MAELIKFPGHNVVYGEEQPQYLPLPALRLSNQEGEAIFCWQLTIWERIKLLFTGKLWHSVYTFNNALQPVMISVSQPEIARVAAAIAKQTDKDIKRAIK